MNKSRSGKILLMLLVFAIFSTPVSAQKTDGNLAKADALLVEAETLLREISVENYQAAIAKTDAAIKIYENLKNAENLKIAKSVKGRAFQLLGNFYLDDNQLDKAGENLKKALSLYNETDFKAGEALTLHNLGVIAVRKNEIDAAIAFYEKAFAAYLQINQPDYAAIIYQNLGGVYFEKKDYGKAIEYLEKSLVIQRKSNDRETLAQVLEMLGRSYINTEDFKTAETYFLEVLPIYESLQSADAVYAYHNLGYTAKRLGKFSDSFGYYDKALELYRKNKDADGEFRVLKTLGENFTDAGEYETAVKYLTKAALLPIAKENVELLADVYFYLGISYNNLLKYEDSVKSYEQSLKIREKLVQTVQQISVLNHIAQTYSSDYQYEKANEYYERQLKIAKDEDLTSSQITALTGLARGNYQLNQSAKSEQFLAQAVALSKQVADDDNFAAAFQAIGQTYTYRKNYVEARKFLSKALQMFKNIGDKESEMFVYTDLGFTYFADEQNDIAVDYYRQAQNLAKELKNNLVLGLTYINFGEVSFAKNRFAEAVEFYKEALKLSGEIKSPIKVGNPINSARGGNIDLAGNKKENEANDIRLKITAWYKIGAAQNELGKYKDALISLEKSFGFAKQVNSKYDQMAAYSDIATSQTELGNYAEGFEANKKALQLAREIRDLYSESVMLNNLGVSYLRLGSFEIAEDYINQSAEIVKKLDDARLSANAEANLGVVYANLKQYGKALNFFNLSLPKLRLQQNNRFFVITSNYYGAVLRETGKVERAAEIHTEAVEVAKIVSPKFESAALNQLGLDYVAQKKYELAVSTFEKALNLAIIAETRDEQTAAFDGLMQSWRGLNKNSAAIFYGKQAVNLLQETRGNIGKLGKDVQANLVKDKTIVYRRLADLLIAEGRLTEAEAVLNLLKEEEFSGLIKRSGNAEENVPYSKAEASSLTVLGSLAALGREKSELAEKLAKSSLTDAEKTRYKEISKEIQTAEAEFNKSLLDLSSAKNTAQNFNTVVNDAQAFMADLKNLSKGTVALYTVIVSGEEGGIKRGWVILVTPEFRKQYQIDVTDLEASVFEFRAALKDTTYDPTIPAQTLYAKIFRQKGKDGKTLENDLDVYFKDKPEKTLMWSLDDVLRYVPMAALHDGDGYLVEKYRNTIFNTASKGRLSDVSKTDWTVLGLGVSQEREESGKPFPKIEGTKRELDSIVAENEKDAGILTGTVIMDEKFTAEAMEDALLFDKNPVVHIASHFSFNATDMDASFLLLGKGKLTVKELTAKSTLFENVDLLALSACDTAMGNGNGREVEGFAYVAQSLGAKAVLASLWQVADTGTDELMIRFYKLRKENPQMSKGEAFRQAQLAMLGGTDLMTKGNSDGNRSGIFSVDGKKKVELPKYKKDDKKPFAHPHYWAAFVLIGNWR